MEKVEQEEEEEEEEEELYEVKAVFELKLDVAYADDNWLISMSDRMLNFYEYDVKFKLYDYTCDANGKLALIRN